MSERDDYDPSGSYPTFSFSPVRKIRGVIGYLGEHVSRMFLVAGLLFVIALPFFKRDLSSVLLPLSIFGGVLLVFLAAFTSKKYKWTIILDVAVSAFGLIIFSFKSIEAYTSYSFLFFLVNLLLAVIFLLSFYFSVSVVREWSDGNAAGRRRLKNYRAADSVDKNYENFDEEERRNLFKKDETT